MANHHATSAHTVCPPVRTSCPNLSASAVAARPALASEAERLGIRPGGIVLTIARVYYTADRPVETADIVIPVERYSLVYEVPAG